jgi:hypothetical protein
MRRRSVLTLVVCTMGSLTATSVGCSSDDRPPVASGGVRTPSDPTGGDGSATPLADGGSTADRCAPDAAPSPGEAVAELTVRADTPPAPLGGELMSGTYVLTEVSRFVPGGASQNDEDGGGGTGSPSSTVLTSKAVVIDGNTYRLAEWSFTGADAGPPALSGGTFALSGTSISFTQTCPAASTRTLGLSAVGTSIALYPTSDRRETYVLR